jgi:hypothetical protein
MIAILQLSGGERTRLLGKISSNLRSPALDRRRARKGGALFFLRPYAFECNTGSGKEPTRLALQIWCYRGIADVVALVCRLDPVANGPISDIGGQIAVTHNTALVQTM